MGHSVFLMERWVQVDGFKVVVRRKLKRREFEHGGIPVSLFRTKWESFSFAVVLPFGMQGLVTGD